LTIWVIQVVIKAYTFSPCARVARPGSLAATAHACPEVTLSRLCRNYRPSSEPDREAFRKMVPVVWKEVAEQVPAAAPIIKTIQDTK
jgi:hypothetical protein